MRSAFRSLLASAVIGARRAAWRLGYEASENKRQEDKRANGLDHGLVIRRRRLAVFGPAGLRLSRGGAHASRSLGAWCSVFGGRARVPAIIGSADTRFDGGTRVPGGPWPVEFGLGGGRGSAPARRCALRRVEAPDCGWAGCRLVRCRKCCGGSA